MTLEEPTVPKAGTQPGRKTAVAPAAAKSGGKASGGESDEESGGGAAGPAGLPDADGIVSSTFAEAGRPAFLLRGRNGIVKGWVMHPADATVTAGDPFRIATKGRDSRIWVVLHVGPGSGDAGADQGPLAQITGSGMDSVLSVAGRKVRFDGKAYRIKSDCVATSPSR